MTKPKLGRPPLPRARRRADRIDLALTPGEALAVRRAARRIGESPNAYARRVTCASAYADAELAVEVAASAAKENAPTAS